MSEPLLEWGVDCPTFNRVYRYINRETARDASRNHDGDRLVVRVPGGNWLPTSAIDPLIDTTTADQSEES